MKKLLFILSLCLLITLSGCGSKKPAESSRVVTKIDITCTQNDVQHLLAYRQPKKIEAVLNYLRCVKYRGKPESNPEDLPGELYEITITNSDGTNRIYRQKENAYLYRSGSWEKIDPNWGNYLFLLLKLMPGD